MKILLLGGNGQLGKSIIDQFKKSKNNIINTSRNDLDICNFDSASKKINNFKPNIIINAAAYTAVDESERKRHLADKVNNLAVNNIAKLCKINNIKLIHFSTDYVFDGLAKTPYKETSTPNPKQAYGLSKLLGENSIIKSDCDYIIIRTSWVYSEYGSNFLKTMLRLGSSQNSIDVVNDEVGCPTYAKDIADALLKIINDININKFDSGIYNYSGDTSCSWYVFAEMIFKEALSKGIKVPKFLNPISSAKFNSMATRPKYSVLDNTKIQDRFLCKPSSLKDGVSKAISNISKENLYND